jgi:hypothetical protein
MVDTPSKRRRGAGKKPRLFSTSIRLPKEVLEYFHKHHGNKKQSVMRSILLQHVQLNEGVNNGSTSNDSNPT